MSLVLDTSIALAWLHRDETTKVIEEVVERLGQAGAWVPSLWRLEVANVLELNVRRGRYTGDFRDRALSNLALFPIRVDPETDRQAWGATARLAERHRLTVYDAAYLELALRRGLPLATLDKDLRIAAGAEKVQLLGI
jgi:predicted nucleic acid-binding protein